MEELLTNIADRFISLQPRHRGDVALKNYVEQYARNFHLTEREMEVLYHLVNRTVSPAELGKKLSISLHTVNNHLKKILETALIRGDRSLCIRG